MDNIYALVFWLSLGLLLFLLYWPWQTYCIDKARQKMFEERAAIFNLAADGAISFESPEYRHIRSQIEALIRFAHWATWPRLALLFLFVGIKSSSNSLHLAVNRIEDADVRKKVRKHVFRTANAAIYMLIWRSPILWLPLGVLFLIRRPFKPKWRAYWRSLSDIIAVESERSDKIDSDLIHLRPEHIR